jgi:hypothetical protein
MENQMSVIISDDLVDFCERNNLGVRACLGIARIMAGCNMPVEEVPVKRDPKPKAALKPELADDDDLDGLDDLKGKPKTRGGARDKRECRICGKSKGITAFHGGGNVCFLCAKLTGKE